MATVRGDGDPGVHGTSQSQTGVYGMSNTGWGVHGMSNTSYGVHGQSDGDYGVRGGSNKSHGVVGETIGSTVFLGRPVAAVYGKSLSSNPLNSARGVVGETSARGTGVRGYSELGDGVHGISGSGERGVVGQSATGLGVHGLARGAGQAGVVGEHTAPSATDPVGVRGKVASPGGTGVEGHGGIDGIGVSGHGIGESGIGVQGGGDIGVYAATRTGTALEARVTHVAGPPAVGAKAAAFFGPVEVFGALTVTGALTKQGGGFRVDDPRDPANKYLNHSFVESSERKNVYDGVAQLDEEGTAWVDLPEWFEALNGDFRYQLTAVGGAAPNLHVAEEVSENRFKIAGGEGGMRVCWQVTGTRKDPWAAANPFEVEQEKPQEERGRYLQPNLYGAPEEQSVMRARTGEMRELPQEPSQAPEEPPSFEPPEPSEMPPGGAGMPPSYVFDMQEEHRQQIDELRGQIEELKRGRMEDEQQRQMDDLRGQIEQLRRRRRKR